MASWKDDADDLINYAKGGEPMLPPYPHGHVGSFTLGPGPRLMASHECRNETGGHTCDICFVPLKIAATVTPLKPKAEPTLQDEILQMLDALAADIRAGEVSPCYLIIGYGDESTLPNGDTALDFIWDATGVNRFELIGHLTTYGTKLANGEGE